MKCLKVGKRIKVFFFCGEREKKIHKTHIFPRFPYYRIFFDREVAKVLLKRLYQRISKKIIRLSDEVFKDLFVGKLKADFCGGILKV